MNNGERWIKRKFLLTSLPDLDGYSKETWERFYLYRKDGTNLRIQKVNNRYELERISNSSGFTRIRNVIQISEDEFYLLRSLTKEVVKREVFVKLGNPTVWVMVYHDRFEGFGRIEVQFKNNKEASDFVPWEWLGKELTGLPLEKEDTMLDLTKEKFQELLTQNLDAGSSPA